MTGKNGMHAERVENESSNVIQSDEEQTLWSCNDSKNVSFSVKKRDPL